MRIPVREFPTTPSGTILPNGRMILPWVKGVQGLENYQPKQVYVTTILEGRHKGPHLHHKRDGLFCCIKGTIYVVTKVGGKYVEEKSGFGGDYALVHVPAGTPAMLVNAGEGEAFVLSMPSEPWDPYDENLVDFDDYWEA